MQFKALNRGELIAIVGGILLGISLFLAWYTLGNQHALLNSCKGPNTKCSGWDSLSIARYVLLLAAVAPLILAYIIARGHALSWPRGELTAVIALVALTLTIFRGVLDKPGSPPGEIGITYRLVGGPARRAADPGGLGVALAGERRPPQATRGTLSR